MTSSPTAAEIASKYEKPHEPPLVIPERPSMGPYWTKALAGLGLAIGACVAWANTPLSFEDFRSGSSGNVAEIAYSTLTLFVIYAIARGVSLIADARAEARSADAQYDLLVAGIKASGRDVYAPSLM
jgi:hypothetical protein